MKKHDVLLVIPAYNEEGCIGTVLDGLRDRGYSEWLDVLVINDGSADATEEVVRSRGVSVLSQVYNMGYGAALQTAYKYAVEKGYEYLVQIDADGQHDLENIDRVMAELAGWTPGAPDVSGAGRALDAVPATRPDIVIGSRFLAGAQSFRISALKRLVIGMFRRIIRATTGKRLTDPTSGLWGLNRRAFTYFARKDNFDTRYPDLNVILQMLLLGYDIREIPAIMHARTAGTSMHAGVASALRYALVMSLSTVGVLVRVGAHKVKA